MSRVTSTAVNDTWPLTQQAKRSPVIASRSVPQSGTRCVKGWSGGSSAQQFDNVQIFIDNDEDGILDAADDIEIDDDFNSGAMSLTYDNNGNLTDDGIFKYVYDAWNRLVEVTRRVDAETTVAQYEYDGKNRRTQKVVSNCGTEHLAGDGGDTTVHFYYGGVAAGLRTGRGLGAGPVRWNVFETRNGSSQTTFRYLRRQGGAGGFPQGD